jgi:hypothetical protein
MAWDGDKQIKINPGNAPGCSHAPALAVSDDNDTLYAVYIGKDGKTLYWSFCEIDPGDGQENLNNWQGNDKVEPPGVGAIEAGDRPGLAYFDGQLQMVYPSHGSGNLMWSSFEDGQWTYQVNFDQFDAYSGWKQPALVVFNGQLHLFVCDKIGTLWHAWKDSSGARPTTDLGSWHGPIGIAMGVSYPSVTVHNKQLHLLYTSEYLNHSYTNHQTLDPGAFVWTTQNWAFPQEGAPNEANPGTAIASFGGNLEFVYTAKGKTNLYSGIYQQDANQITLGEPVQVGNTEAKTNAPPALAVFDGQLCLVHKGNSNDNLYLAYSAD